MKTKTYDFYKMKKSTMAATGAGLVVGGLIAGIAIFVGILCIPAAAIGGGIAAGLLIAHAAPVAWGGWGIAAAVVGGLAASSIAGRIGGHIGNAIAHIGIFAGLAAGAVVGGATKGIGAATEALFGINKKRRTAKLPEDSSFFAQPAANAASAFKVPDVKAQFVAAQAQAGNDNNRAVAQAVRSQLKL